MSTTPLFPIAISSQLDDSGVERLHAANLFTEGDEISLMSNFVYELERGWSFDGYYIPHFLEVNWYFGEDPIHYHTIHKLRIHGLTKGNVNLQVAANGMQTTYLSDYTSNQYIDLKSPVEFVSSDFYSTTETTDLENRGLAIQLKFSGRNTNELLPEPPHVLQVLVVQSSPDGTGFTAN